MNELSYSSILIAVTNFFTAIILFSRSKGNKHTIIWGMFCLIIVFWGIGGYWASMANDRNIAYRGWQIANVTSIFAPVVYCHFVSSFLNLNRKKIIFVAYCLAVIVFSINVFFREIFLGDLIFVHNQFYYISWDRHVNPFYVIFYIIFYWGLLPYAFFELLIGFFNSKFGKKNQIKYFILGTSMGWLGAHGDFLSVFNPRIYPHLNFLCGIYPIIIGYAIIKYRLLDISVVLTRTGVFISVYSLVLGIPFLMAFGLREKLIASIGVNWWLVPLISSTILATTGPFIYLFIQKRAEDRLLKEQKRYQLTLRQASSGMGRIKDIKRLTKLIVHIVTRTVHLEHSAVYLYNPIDKVYSLEAYRHTGPRETNGRINDNSLLIKYLEEIKYPVIYEEVKQRLQDYGDPRLVQIEANLLSLDAALVVPSFIDDRLIAVIVLGKKRSGQFFSEDDLSIFSILANQAALSIENCQFYEDAKRTHEQLFQAEKMATIGTMADGLSHQINNRLHAMGFIASDALDTIKMKSPPAIPLEMKEVIDTVQFSLMRIQENVKQGGEIVQGLLKYTRKGEIGFSAVDLDRLIDSSLDMVQYKIKMDQFLLLRDYSKDLPKIKGNFTQLQEVFFNLIDNAYDAIMQRKTEENDPEYKGKIQITAVVRNGDIEIGVLDNGTGVKQQDENKLFTPFFTTKLSSKKGTGLGLYVIKRIVEDNHGGRIAMSSEHMVGTLFSITLPMAI